MDIKISIADDKIQTLADAFCRANPIPIKDGAPKFTQMDWVRKCIKTWLISAAKEQIEREAAYAAGQAAVAALGVEE